MTVMERSLGSEKTKTDAPRLPEPLDYDYVDHLIDSRLSFFWYDDVDETTDMERVIVAARERGEPGATVGFARLMWEVEDDTFGWEEDENGYVETGPSIWWQAQDREEFDEYPYEFGQIPLVADNTSMY